MSITALILTKTVADRNELAAKHGPAAIINSLFFTAARLIAGDYEN